MSIIPHQKRYLPHESENATSQRQGGAQPQEGSRAFLQSSAHLLWRTQQMLVESAYA